jgi:two-component system response regulator RegA
MIGGTETGAGTAPPGQAGRLLLVDDDAPLRRNLVRSLERVGYEVATAESLREAYDVAATFQPDFAVIDLNLGDGHGMELVESLQTLRPGLRVVVLTGYDSIASSIVAAKAGALAYLAKPVKPEELAAALVGDVDSKVDDSPMSADRVRWEHIQRVFEQCNRNVSETARRLNMHRRTLQRILSKRAPRP